MGLIQLLLLTAMVITTVKCSYCHQDVNCFLPHCSCGTYSSPLPVRDTPQIIFYGFDDALNGQMAQHYRKLFSSDRKNPNGCPISMSLYVQHAYTDYRLVREFYKKGMEIGVHSVTHTNIDTEAKLADEAEHQKSNLAQLGSVPKDEIVGWRSPNLKTAGDKQPSTLNKLGYTYDISLTYTVGKRHQKKPWPYTLDYGFPYNCQIPPCPKRTTSHKGFWEVPIIALMDYKGAYPCAYVDGCYNSPTTEEDSFEYLWKNFEDNYETRTPLGFNMHAAWFQRPHNLAAMDGFINEMTKKDDVYIVSVQKMLEWMRHPTKLSELHKLEAWGCKAVSKIRNPNNVRSASAGRTAWPPYPTPRPPRPTPRPVITNKTPRPIHWWRTRRVHYPSSIISPWWRKKPTEKGDNWREETKASSLPKPIDERRCLWNWCKRQTTAPRYVNKVTTSQQQQRQQHQQQQQQQQQPQKKPRFPTPKPPRYWKTVKTTEQTTKAPIWRRRTSRPKNNDASREKDVPKTSRSAPTTPSRHSIFAPPSAKYCVQERTCKLPACQCRSLSPPGALPSTRVPQMIYFTFDGPINQRSHPFYLKIFNKDRKNPNGCPISATFFVSKRGNFIPYLMSHVNNGHEIAIQGDEPGAYRHSANGKYDFSKELQYMLTKLPVTPILGWRSPSMRPSGDTQFKSLLDNQMLYDSTLTTRTASGNLPWPYTLDFRWQDACSVGGCPTKSYPGLWEIPVKPLLDVKKLYPCVYADGCMNNPWTEDDTFEYLMDNFWKYYEGNRGPMGISFRQTWFSHQVYRPNVNGLIRFIDKLLTMDDVYIVSIKQLVQWLQQPTPLSRMKWFAPWRC
ncbi:uncharacterized protein LOC121388620 [Gigantopelta aegis]|uniref:uncharacterized protein LOC121388620 n=1 Tax=Gigantopelta aegis TaxID=1735272 RepID=UPI001B88DEAC|nr:uncharacterized protein LOC121388620 [Gigantopelta aegis]